MSTLRIQNLAKRYEGFTLEVPSFTLEPGTFVALVGENGAGKTTLMRCISGFITSYDGKVSICGESPQAAWQAGRVGFMSEDVKLIGDLSVGANMELAAALSPRWDPGLASKLCQKLRIDLTKSAHELSRGNQVKVGLVVAMARRPSLLLLDEPTSGLDPLVRDLVLSELALVREIGCAALVSSHILDDFRDLADRVAVVRHGRIHCEFENPRNSEQLRDCVMQVLQ